MTSGTITEPNTLTHADHVRRFFTTDAGALRPGVSRDDYSAAYENAVDQDRTTRRGPDPPQLLSSPRPRRA